MNTISHGILGILFYKILNIINPELFIININILIIIFIISNIPDIDIIWAKTLESHHKSLLHIPLFWIGIYIFSLFFINYIFSTIFIICIILHLISDYICARTAGIKLFYPINNKEYSLYKLDKPKGIKKIYKQNKKEKLDFMKFYLKNKKLIAFEYGIYIITIFIIT